MPAAASRRASVPARASKGEVTRAQILAAAVVQASASGFESLTIGTLAERTGLSKSGLFAHFGSKQELQLAALDEAARQFTEGVFLPALKAPRGVKRLRSLFEHWVSWPRRAHLPGGCPIDAATREYLHQPGPMRDAVIERQKELERGLRKAIELAIETGELSPEADAQQIAFDFVGLILALTRAELLLGDQEAQRRAREAFDRLLRTNAA
ncbi:MAG TPA: TetR/AcrR family transcriptional regulator [Usitatibacter sp.]|jgi:AcrR family transcriptional regulator|nr:TetR/AcrR family transcriptional regulator [Usitatibacter sp.]